MHTLLLYLLLLLKMQINNKNDLLKLKNEILKKCFKNSVSVQNLNIWFISNEKLIEMYILIDLLLLLTVLYIVS